MKKLILFCATLLLSFSVFTSMCINASARNWIISPEASTYTSPSKPTGVDHDSESDNKTSAFTHPGDTTSNTDNTNSSTDNNSTTNGQGTTGHSNNNDNNSTSKTTHTKYSRTTNEYNNNKGNDDPSSPNYTGHREIVSDKSLTSPDTAATPNNRIFVVTSVMFAAIFILVCFSLNKFKKERTDK